MTSGPGRVRASGMQAAEEEAAKAGDELEEPLAPQVDVERERSIGQLGFTRMKMAWTNAEAAQMRRIRNIVDGRIDGDFGDVYRIMHDLYLLVREQAVDERTGVLKVDRNTGHPEWKTTPSGAPVEDWSRLTNRQREEFLFRIQTRLFDWELRAADLRSEALFAKSAWQERFSAGYNRAVAGTVDDRNNAAQVEAASDRYFALLMGAASQKADALVRAMSRLADRLQATIPR
jgi:hypothetical protein